jgi:hypothetical protein
MAPDISSVVRPEIEQGIPAAEAPAHRISGEPPVPRERGIPETPFISNPVLVRRVSTPPMKRAVDSMIFISVIMTAMGCLAIYFLIRGLTPPPKWLILLLG